MTTSGPSPSDDAPTRRYGGTAVRRYGGTAVRRYGGTAVRRYGGTAVRPSRTGDTYGCRAGLVPARIIGSAEVVNSPRSWAMRFRVERPAGR
ncbi:hypothetical protein [Streptomyces sp. NPDC001999]